MARCILELQLLKVPQVMLSHTGFNSFLLQSYDSPPPHVPRSSRVPSQLLQTEYRASTGCSLRDRKGNVCLHPLLTTTMWHGVSCRYVCRTSSQLRICAKVCTSWDQPFRNFVPSKYVQMLEICKMKIYTTQMCTPPGNMYPCRKFIPQKYVPL